MSDLIIYIIVGILWLIFTALGKKQKQQQKQRPKPSDWSLEEALRGLEIGRRGDDPMTAPPPEPQVRQPAAPTPASSRWPDEFQGFQTTFADDTFEKPAVRPPSEPPARPAPPPKPAAKKSKVPRSKIVARLRDTNSAQTAVVLSEVLGKPRAHRPPVGFPRIQNP